MLGLAKPYRSFDRGGWHFIVLDSVSPQGDGYVGKLDDEQMEWLRADLARVPATTPVLVLSHIPIFTASVLHDPKDSGVQEGWFVPNSLMLGDSHKVRKLLGTHGNVRLCVSGHIHLLDRVDFNGISYVCDGAVSGAWWRGAHYECREGYGRFDLHADGTWSHRYVTYGWQAAAAAAASANNRTYPLYFSAGHSSRFGQASSNSAGAGLPSGRMWAKSVDFDLSYATRPLTMV